MAKKSSSKPQAVVKSFSKTEANKERRLARHIKKHPNDVQSSSKAKHPATARSKSKVKGNFPLPKFKVRDSSGKVVGVVDHTEAYNEFATIMFATGNTKEEKEFHKGERQKYRGEISSILRANKGSFGQINTKLESIAPTEVVAMRGKQRKTKTRFRKSK